MTPDTAISRIKGQLGNWSGTNIDTWIVNELNAAVRRLQKLPDLPWFLFKDTNVLGTNLVTVIGTETVALPSDFLREPEELIACLFSQDTGEDDTWTPILKDDYSVLKARYTGTGRPKHYDLIGSSLYLRQIPDAAYTLRLLYYQQDAVITAGSTETTWLTQREDLLIAEAGMVIAAQYVRDERAAQMFMLRRQEERKMLQDEITARHEAARDRVMGGAD